MSSEKKMRELMARLVSMSPEPPPYPEGTLMAGHQKKTWRPGLVFATAAAVVAVLALPLILLGGDPDPVLSGSTTTSTSTTTAETSTTNPGTTSTTPPVSTTTEEFREAEVGGVVYLYQASENSAVGNPALVPFEAALTGSFDPGTDFFTAWQMFIEGREGLPLDFSTAVPADVMVRSRVIEDDMIVADMNEAFLDGAVEPGLLSDFTMLNQLIYTLTHDAPDMAVSFTVDGEPVGIFGTEGIELTEPVTRESFRDWMHVIDLTRPITPGDDGNYVVEGIANVFEATVSIAVINAAEETVHEEFVTASCGTGCWGDFSTTIDAELVVPGESSIRIFTHSAQDGSIVEAITVPIPEDDVWEYAVDG